MVAQNSARARTGPPTAPAEEIKHRAARWYLGRKLSRRTWADFAGFCGQGPGGPPVLGDRLPGLDGSRGVGRRLRPRLQRPGLARFPDSRRNDRAGRVGASGQSSRRSVSRTSLVGRAIAADADHVHAGLPRGRGSGRHSGVSPPRPALLPGHHQGDRRISLARQARQPGCRTVSGTCDSTGLRAAIQRGRRVRPPRPFAQEGSPRALRRTAFS
jgi:hypothetical protein